MTGPPGVNNRDDRLFRLICDRKCVHAQSVRTQPAFAPGSANTLILITSPFSVRIGTVTCHLLVLFLTIMVLLSLSMISSTFSSTNSILSNDNTVYTV